MLFLSFHVDPEIYKDWGACSNFNIDKKEKGSAVRDLLLFRHHSSSFDRCKNSKNSEFY